MEKIENLGDVTWIGDNQCFDNLTGEHLFRFQKGNSAVLLILCDKPNCIFCFPEEKKFDS